ncbi:chemotaxis protein CheW [uncultured Aureimonas sp.]|uniref:chemotaxis protein CheW n=1 Tax=uncultured Aureimonas sp. TaxID=1604662 RepID=UPI0025E92F22|nr:chemotaxis protein CheW [uncultured Aureimonas sp.]
MTPASRPDRATATIGVLVCEAGGRAAALPLAGVLGVTEPSPVTPLPFSPPLIDGLVLAMNLAVVQMTLAPLFGGPRPAEGAGVLVVAAQSDDVRALRLDAVLAMAEIGTETIADEESVDALAGGFLTGRFEWNGRSVALLDLPALWAAGSLAPADLPPAEGAGLLARIEPADAAAPLEGNARARTPFLSIVSGGEPYAVPSAAIEEILLVEAVRPMPGAPPFVAGLVDRHGTPILALDTRRLLGHEPAPGARTALVLPFARGVVALLVEQAQGIVFFEEDDPHPMTEAAAGIASYLVDERGRIVGLVDPQELLAQVAAQIGDLMPQRLEASAPERPGPDARTGEAAQLLVVSVGDDAFALPLDRVERIRPEVRLTPLPRSDTGFTGVADVGETTVPMLDLRDRLLPGSGAPRTGHPPCVLVRLEGALAGLAVDRVLRIEAVERSRIDAVEPQDRLPVSGVFEAADGRLASILMIDRLLPLMPAALR